MMDDGKPWYEECPCGSDIFKVKVTPLGEYATDNDWICAKCGELIGGIINDPFNEVPEE